MSTLNVSTIQNVSTLTTSGQVSVGGNLLMNSSYGSAAVAYGCRAWVNFNGTTASPSTMRGSGNVSSITKGSTGVYTVNFTTAMPDANYSQHIHAFPETASGSAYGAGSYRGTVAKTTSLFTFATVSYNDSSFADFQEIDVIVHR